MLPYLDKLDPWSSHSIIIQWLKTLPSGSVVVDIGTASGTLGRLCQSLDLQLIGIEPNREWAAMAAPFYKELIVGEAQNFPKTFFTNADAIILADVLEHLPDPEKMLDNVIDKQNQDRVIIISVPNVANLWIRLGLFFGKFEYTDRGILDRTHLRFYTRSTLQKMLHKAGLAVSLFQVTPIPLNLMHPFFEKHRIGKWLHGVLATITHWFPTLLGYQWVVLAKLIQ